VEKRGNAAGQKDKDNNAKQRPQNCGDGKLARYGSELQPTIHDD
jgi:hypothetical protein